MNLQQIEFFAYKFLELCQLHPEICPHDYKWQMTCRADENGIREKHYECSLCGDKKIVYTYDGADWNDGELTYEEALRSKQRYEELKQSRKN